MVPLTAFRSDNPPVTSAALVMGLVIIVAGVISARRK